VVLLIVLAVVIRKLTRRKPSLIPVGMPDAIEMSANASGALSGDTVAGQLAGGKLFGAGDGNALVERVRQMVNQDHTPATAVMRAWLRE
jgi:flagellar biosynthesis/type III secretory pathway M-ring protein FliF/YscJ